MQQHRFLLYRDCLGLNKTDRNYYANVTRTTTWTDGNVLTSAALNGEFNNLLNALNIVNADISGSANIAASKISGTAATLGATQSFTGVNTYSAATKQFINTDTDASTITFDLNVANIHQVTLGGNRTLALANPSVGQVFILVLIQDSTGGRTVTWFSTIKWAGGSAPALTSGATKTDTFAFVCTSSGNYLGFVVGQNA